MLSDSKVRQAGFIRNNSSRKILYQPEPQRKKKQNSSDDSFSSFQYEGTSKISYKSRKKHQKSQIEQVKSLEKGTIKTKSPYIPPKPEKKLQIKNPTFTNQRLKNNFFQEPVNISKSKQKPLQMIKPASVNFPRVSTPQFQQSTFKHEIQQVQNICNRIEGIKLMEGNFSFNPKLNKFKKERDFVEKESSQIKNVLHNEQQISDIVPKKTKQNNYFNEAQGHKFQYDFQSSSQSDIQEQQDQSFGEKSQQIDDEAIKYYQQEQQKRDNKFQTGKKVSKNNFPSNYQLNNQQSNQYQSQNYPKRVQNEQSEDDNEQLISDYKKTDFGLKLTSQLRKDASLRNQERKRREQQQQGVILKNEGICFEVDVKQFNQGTGNNESYPSTKKPFNQNKKKKVNEKEELLKRRQMAKTYSKQARFRLFGFA